MRPCSDFRSPIRSRNMLRDVHPGALVHCKPGYILKTFRLRRFHWAHKARDIVRGKLVLEGAGERKRR
jgi:hypothetical protein